MGKAKRKLHIFKHYRANIELLCEDPYYNRNVLKDIIICPLCFNMFYETDVKQKDGNNFLTIEHVPPKYLGGTTEVLTCNKCNNFFSEFDNEIGFGPHRPDSKIVKYRTKYKSGESDDDKLGAVTEFNFTTDMIRVDFSNKNDLLKFAETAKNKNKINFEVKDKTKAVGTNLMKVAYLLAFHKFGYGLILHPQYNFIREQFKLPYENVIDKGM
jgi:hypothetical protein